jgi:hypothetical protein
MLFNRNARILRNFRGVCLEEVPKNVLLAGTAEILPGQIVTGEYVGMAEYHIEARERKLPVFKLVTQMVRIVSVTFPYTQLSNGIEYSLNSCSEMNEIKRDLEVSPYLLCGSRLEATFIGPAIRPSD